MNSFLFVRRSKLVSIYSFDPIEQNAPIPNALRGYSLIPHLRSGLCRALDRGEFTSLGLNVPSLAVGALLCIGSGRVNVTLRLL